MAKGESFSINIADQLKLPENRQTLPVFIYTDNNESPKYIIPLSGSGLWGPIWGYISVENDGNTVYGAYFAHQGETPGLGAEIEKPQFQEQFQGKHFFIDGNFTSIAVEKAGHKSPKTEPTMSSLFQEGQSQVKEYKPCFKNV